MSKVALVTGSNKGIGYATVEGLCKVFNGTVFMAGRDNDRVRVAAEQLREKGYKNLETCRIDLDDPSTFVEVRDMMLKKYGGLDVLVNNAGIAYKGSDSTPFDVQARVTMDIDYHGLVSLCDTLFPILKSGARVVHLSSMCSMFAFRNCSEQRKQEVLKCDTVSKVTGLMKNFVDLAQRDEHNQAGFPSHGYGIAKMGVSMVTPLQQQLIDGDTSRSDIVINCCCPGYVNTDMTSHRGTKTPDQGAETPLMLALLPNNTPYKGLYFSECKPSDWTEGHIPVPTELMK